MADRRRSRGPRTRTIALAAGIPFLIGVLVLTLWSSPVEDSMPVLLGSVLSFLREDLGWQRLEFLTLEKIANIVVFIPLGVFAFFVFPRRRWPFSLLVGPTLSLIIECTQGLFLPDRRAAVMDVLTNSLGATIGVLLALLATQIVRSVRAATATRAERVTRSAPARDARIPFSPNRGERTHSGDT